MDRRVLSSLAFLALASACAGPTSDAPLSPPTSREVPFPSGEGSSEPSFSPSARDPLHLTWIERGVGGAQELRMSRWEGSAWGATAVVVASDRLFLNWADLPGVVPGPDGSLWAHWLERDEAGGYGVRVAHSGDGGASWSAPWTPHQDEGTAAEHGFVAAVPMSGAVAFAWLDGRGLTSRAADAATGLYFRVLRPDGPAGPESLIDPRVCDCCQMDVAVTDRGAVLAYRDRSPEEIRDVHVTTWRDGAWSAPRRVHEDGWQTGACPVNGPAIDARGERVAIAWFTAAEGIPRVKVAFSRSSAERFDEPVVVDDGDPAGRVDVVLTEDGSALVSWVERTQAESSEVRIRRVAPDGRTSESERVGGGDGERVSGVPRMVRSADDRVWLAWTDATTLTPRVRVASIEAREGGAP